MSNNQPTTTEEKPGASFNPVEFVRETRREIAKVTWPTRKETLMTTVMIICMALIFGLFFFGVDSLLGVALGHLLGMRSS